MPSEARARRIADRIFHELAILFQRQVADPRLAGLTVTGVDLDREYSFATVFISGLNREAQTETMQALEQASGYLRSELASRIPMRTFPKLRFRWDESSDRGARVDELLDRLREERGDED